MGRLFSSKWIRGSILSTPLEGVIEGEPAEDGAGGRIVVVAEGMDPIHPGKRLPRGRRLVRVVLPSLRASLGRVTLVGDRDILCETVPPQCITLVLGCVQTQLLVKIKGVWLVPGKLEMTTYGPGLS